MKTINHSTLNDNYSILIWKIAIGSTVSWEIAKLLGSDHPYLAPLSVILCLQATLNNSVNISIKRVIGTIIGILVTVLIASHVKRNGLNLGLLILIGCFITKCLKFDKIVTHHVAITILFVFVFEHQSKHYAVDRMRDTIIGVIVTVLIQLVWFKIIEKYLKKHSSNTNA
ncbi:FUSC family protein [Bacillus sp. FJAT-49732]|uniref:FUSC family protein n=1 Tax=Lederbergia citrisecunda TaxID=2833583 RepID=A0A942TJM9_9BACI|nr:FUSC family protein [Lederbergia citrisecunda]MBS4198328.1 FUSC family protein [Lederbergia citrisecunda]